MSGEVELKRTTTNRHEGFNDDDEIGNKAEPRTCNLRSIELPLKVKNIILNACYIRK